METNIYKGFYSGRIVRHKGERKVIRRVMKDNHGELVIEFVDLSKCNNMRDIELDGRK